MAMSSRSRSPRPACARRGPTSLVVDMKKASIELSDVTLKGRDGAGAVPASKFLLAARSRVFRGMLCGEFIEASSREITLPYETEVIEALVHYAASDEILSFEYMSDEEEARTLTGLVSASHYYEMPRLERMAIISLTQSMEDRPPLACIVLEQTKAIPKDEAFVANLRRRALDVIRYRTKEALLPVDGTHGRGVASLSASLLQEIVADELIHADETTLFRCVMRWLGRGRTSFTEDQPNGAAGCGTKRKLMFSQEAVSDDEGKVDQEDKLATAKAMIKMINLSRIPPSYLKSLVAESGLVSPSVIAAAYEAQALRAERRGFAFAEPRSTLHRRGKVLVHGGGVPGVNGEYYPAGTYDSVPKYQKTGLYKGRQELFTLYRFQSSDGTRKWYLSIVPTNVPPGDDDRDFYFLCSDFDTPFGRTYQTKEEGVDPAPICIWEPEPDDYDDVC